MKYMKSMSWITGLLATQLSLADVSITNNSDAPITIDGKTCAADTTCHSDTAVGSVTLGDRKIGSNLTEGQYTVSYEGQLSSNYSNTVAGSGGTSSTPPEPDFRK